MNKDFIKIAEAYTLASKIVPHLDILSSSEKKNFEKICIFLTDNAAQYKHIAITVEIRNTIDIIRSLYKKIAN